jgi:hypothetical protein
MDDLDRFLRSLGIGSGSDREETPEDQPIYAVASRAAGNTDATRRFISGAARSLRRQGIPAWATLSEKAVVTGPAWLLVVRTEHLDRAKGAFDAYMKRVNKRVRRNPTAD